MKVNLVQMYLDPYHNLISKLIKIMIMAILLRLLFAHILSDFVFQNDKICEAKQEKTQRSMFINYYIVSSML